MLKLTIFFFREVVFCYICLVELSVFLLLRFNLKQREIMSNRKNVSKEYKEVLDFIRNNVNNSTLLGVNAWGGSWELEGGEQITLTPSWEKGNKASLVRLNTQYHIKSFLDYSGITLTIDEDKLLKKLNKYIEKEYKDY